MYVISHNIIYYIPIIPIDRSHDIIVQRLRKDRYQKKKKKKKVIALYRNVGKSKTNKKNKL